MGAIIFWALYIFWCSGLVLLYAYLDDEKKLPSIPKFLQFFILAVLMFLPLLFVPFIV
jgi:hypothetical protein